MKVEEIEKALSRGHFGEYHLEICRLLARIHELEEGINHILSYNLPYLAEKKCKELLKK